MIVRVYNPTDNALEGKLESFYKMSDAKQVALDESAIEDLKVVGGNSIALNVPKKKIMTLEFKIGS